MYIFGGRTEEGTDLGDLAAFRITSRRWYTFQNMGPSPSPRSGHSMTAFGKQIVVLAGEPSSAPRDAGELSLVYVLNTDKIRYPNDQQIQQTPSGERVPGNRRPSQERGMTPQNRMINGPGPEGLSRNVSGSRESMAGPPRGPGPGPGPGPGGRGQDMSMGNGPSPPGPGSRLPRASMAQAPSGPPPQQQAPRPNGVMPPTNGPPNGSMNGPMSGPMNGPMNGPMIGPMNGPMIGPMNGPMNGPMSGPRSRTPTRETRGYGPPLDTGRGEGFEKENAPPIVSPTGREGSRQGPNSRAMSPVVNGRRTPTQQPMQQSVQQQVQQPPRLMNQVNEDEDIQKYDSSTRSRSRQAAQEAPLDEIDQFPAAGSQQPRSFYNRYDSPSESPMRNNRSQKDENAVPRQQLEQLQSQHQGLQNQLEGLQDQHEGLRGEQEDLKKELEAAKSPQRVVCVGTSIGSKGRVSA